MGILCNCGFSRVHCSVPHVWQFTRTHASVWHQGGWVLVGLARPCGPRPGLNLFISATGEPQAAVPTRMKLIAAISSMPLSVPSSVAHPTAGMRNNHVVHRHHPNPPSHLPVRKRYAAPIATDRDAPVCSGTTVHSRPGKHTIANGMFMPHL